MSHLFAAGSASYVPPSDPNQPLPRPLPPPPAPYPPRPPWTVVFRSCGCGVWEGEWCDCDEFGQGAPDITWPGPIGGES